jgi:hypothetical protein
MPSSTRPQKITLDRCVPQRCRRAVIRIHDGADLQRLRYRIEQAWNLDGPTERGSHAPFRPHPVDPSQHLHVVSAAGAQPDNVPSHDLNRIGRWRAIARGCCRCRPALRENWQTGHIAQVRTLSQRRTRPVNKQVTLILPFDCRYNFID